MFIPAFFSVLFGMVLSPFFLDKAIAASELRRHYIVSQDQSDWFGQTVEGARVFSNNPNTKSGYYPTGADSVDFITKALWVEINGGKGAFVETGISNGAMVNQDKSKGYVYGMYAAYGNSNTGEYKEKRLIGMFDISVGAGNWYKIEYLGDKTKYWRISINNTKVLDVYGQDGKGHADHGFEMYGDGDEKLLSKSASSSFHYKTKGSWYAPDDYSIIRDKKKEINITCSSGCEKVTFAPN